jgi:hypothetical protein
MRRPYGFVAMKPSSAATRPDIPIGCNVTSTQHHGAIFDAPLGLCQGLRGVDMDGSSRARHLLRGPAGSVNTALP